MAHGFFFEEKWLLDPNITDDFVDHWEAGHDPNEWSCRLAQCREFFQNWSGKRFDCLPKQIQEVRKAKSILEDHTSDSKNSGELERVQRKLETLLEMEECHWKARSRVQWLAHGDRNTKMFHASATERRNRNFIYGLEDREGVWRSDERDKGNGYPGVLRGLISELQSRHQSDLSSYGCH